MMNIICLVIGHDWAIVIRGRNVFSVCSRCWREEGREAVQQANQAGASGAIPRRGIDAERSHDETKD